ncbi:DUF72 domain-containing protein [Pseudomonas citronellolis]|uniref:DUF72 domain-containing protein n=1 Tax=Pseudomonas citronellolis TaxID=53408 RepID=A0AAW6PDU0_9PSED|nr:DUF72 domain-containing protein [Pseudomonas citronellolis]MDF3844319.1 DUF72 domain-containing protein [Pseudomonas citronellolis]
MGTDGLHIGISGWRYAPWRGEFYPRGLPQREELRYAAHAFASIELNGSFYGLQTPGRYRQWKAQTPAGFRFSVKGPRFVTHLRRLREPQQGLANFFASGPLELDDKLGAFLWQLPPSLAYDGELLEAFLALLPRDSHAAAELAGSADARLRHEAPSPGRRFALRHALEVRHKSFCSAEFTDQLRRHGVALVMADAPSKWPYAEDLTAPDFTYLRLHGAEQLYASGYGEAALRRWSERIRLWRNGLQPADAELIDADKRGDRRHRELYCYFDNDIKVRAPFDAFRLMQLLDIRLPQQQVPGEPAEDWT